jgi:hypothetical protein
MKTRYIGLLLSLGVLALSSCSNPMQKPIDPKPILFIDGIALSVQELKELPKLANAGDADSATKLAHHFMLAANDEDKARYWFHKAAILGGDEERENYEAFMEGYKH